MRKILIVISLLFSAISYALHIKPVGNAVLMDNGSVTTFVFADQPEVKTDYAVGETSWYQAQDTIRAIQSGTDYLYPEYGQVYSVKINGKRESFVAYPYDSVRPQLVDVELSCDQTVINLDIPTIADSLGNTSVRMCHVTYLDAVWGENGWGDSLVVVELPLTKRLVLGASPLATNFIIRDAWIDSLGLGDEYEICTPLYQPIAMKVNPQAIVTTRGADEKSNEVERPVDAQTLIKRSAPLDVEFRANALNTDYYQWNLYKGSELILKRTESQHRYTFTEPGNYRVVMGASNSHGCSIDSVQFDISVSESLLKVPNTFTPNGDGMNDEFRVVYRSIKEFHCWVYNRWGKLVYEWTDPAKGWDGNIGGRPAAEGAYYYVIRALGTDATEGYMSKPAYQNALNKQEQPIGVYQLSGDINLLR